MSGGRVISISSAQSQISTDITNPPADGTTPTTVYVSVKQEREANGEPLNVQNFDASNVTVTADPATGVVITQPTGTVGADGTAVATFTSTNAATISIGAEAFGRTLTGTATVVVGGGAPPPVDPGDPFFTDTFAGGVRNNADGFTWGSGGSRVTVQLAPDASGDYALRFRFGPDAGEPDPGDSNAEQRWNLGRNVTDLWIDYQVWVPSNYVHRNLSGPDNNKFLRLWGDSYDAINKVGASTNPNTTTMIPSQLFFEGRQAPSGTGMGNISGTPMTVFGNAPMIGVWTRIRVHFKMVTAAENDGVFRLWKGDTLAIERTDIPLNFDSAVTYWNQGYFFGWSNSGFTDETFFYIRGGANGPKFYDTDPEWT
jgi:hypothetical protein